ncbi:MAG: helix-turn-helix transcriptional regulator [Firmicutes bacterium]|nr:helix-turn-helix transcriptional regulator [Bacillota bacterium]
MTYKNFPVIDMSATGRNIKRLRLEKGLSVRQLQSYFGFDEPQAIYKWQRGESLPSVDNLYALGSLLDVPMEEILVPVTLSLKNINEQQDKTCCSVFLSCFDCGKRPKKDFNHFRSFSLLSFLRCPWTSSERPLRSPLHQNLYII